MRPLLYCVQRYRPDREATSKEIQLLQQHFQGQIHDLHLDGKLRFRLAHPLTSYHFLYYPLGFLPLRLYARHKIIHLYTSLCDRPYLPVLNRKNMIITSPNFFSQKRIKSKMSYLQEVRQIIVQSEVEKKELLRAGIKEEKVTIIYPAVELERFSYHEPTMEPTSNGEPAGNFTILNASCPGKVKDLQKRGIYFLLDLDPYLKDEQIKFLWRGGEFSLLKEEIKKRTFQHIHIENNIYADMNEQYGQAHCTIIPYLQFDEYLKLVPSSVLESLAAGKPVLVSSQTGVAEIIRNNGCGVVFEPERDKLLAAIAELRRNYQQYQRNCRKTAEKYFSKEQFLKKHEQVYAQIGAPTGTPVQAPLTPGRKQ